MEGAKERDRMREGKRGRDGENKERKEERRERKRKKERDEKSILSTHTNLDMHTHRPLWASC